MATVTREQIKEVARRIAEKYQPEKIILFGSHAWGTPGPDSDVDLFIITDADDTREAARRISRFVFPRQFALDVLVNTPTYVARRKKAGDFFMRDILQKGEVLYEK